MALTSLDEVLAQCECPLAIRESVWDEPRVDLPFP
jgi:hypothetical protein